MKKLIGFSIVALVLATALLVIAAPFKTGYGKDVTASTTTQRIDGFAVNGLSVYNTNPTNYAKVLVNCSIAEMSNRVVLGTAISVPPNAIVDFDADSHAQIESLCYQTTNLTSDLNVTSF